MGSCWGSTSVWSEQENNTKAEERDYSKYTIEDVYFKSGYTVAQIKYQNNSNPIKILVYEGDKRKYLSTAKEIDPHFNIFEMDCPIARFNFSVNGIEALHKFLK